MHAFANIMRIGSVSLDLTRWVTKFRYFEALCSCLLIAADLLAFSLAGLIGLAAARFIGFGGTEDALRMAMALAACLIGYLGLHGRYSDRLPFWSGFRIVLSTSWLGGALITLWLLASGQVAAFMPSVVSFALFPVLAIVADALAKSALSRSGLWIVDILLVGENDVVAVVEGAIRSAPSLGYRLIRRVDPAAVAAAPAGGGLRSVMQRSGARRVIIALDPGHRLRRTVIEAAQAERVDFAVLTGCADSLGTPSEAASFLSHDAVLMALRQGQSNRLSRSIKIGFDVVAAMLLLILTLPVFLAIIVLNRLDCGPVFFAHRRVGLAGQPFYCLKFRTMVVDGDSVLKEALARDPALAQEWADTQKLRDDPRVTWLGRILRKTSLDELPQLVNVLRLEMSLVGPRPIVTDEIPKFGDDIIHYYATRPGLTGLWQVSGRSDTSFGRRVQLDVWYATNWTLWNDIAVLLRTIPAVLAHDGAY